MTGMLMLPLFVGVHRSSFVVIDIDELVTALRLAKQRCGVSRIGAAIGPIN